jgi:hypothetical protein
VADTRRMKHGDQWVEGYPVDFKTGGESFNEYWCADGTTIRLKVVVTDIVRVKGAFNADGDPVYLVRSQNVLSVNAPDALRRVPPLAGGAGPEFPDPPEE